MANRDYSFQNPPFWWGIGKRWFNQVVVIEYTKVSLQYLVFSNFSKKQLKLQLKFEKSSQTLVKYILGIEIFKNCLFIKIDY